MKKGDIVIVPFPFSDDSDSKPRPALVLSGTTYNATDEVILVQISSSGVMDKYSVAIAPEDLNQPLKKVSVVRCNKLFVAHKKLIKGEAGSVKTSLYVKVQDIILNIIREP